MKRTIVSISLFILVAAAIALSGCSSNDSQAELQALQATNAALTQQVEDLTAQVEVLEDKLSQATSTSLLGTALDAVELIAAGDFVALAAMVHPVSGVRFSPYGYVDVAEDLVFTAAELAGLMQDTQQYTWGSFDGTGFPIELTFTAYYDRFVYDVDFANPQFIGINNIIGMGNTLINLNDVYPDGAFVEFHFSGFDPQYEGMDWRSLRLVFEEQGGEWMLVGIVHDEWTI